jgi:predicted transcriptional regulator
VQGNAQLKALLDQIADFLPEEYRRKWGLRAKASDAAGFKVSQL